MVIDTQATPKMAQTVIENIRSVTDKPIKYVVLSHYHAVRVLGATAYESSHVICSEATREMYRRARRAGTTSPRSSASRACSRRSRPFPGLTCPPITFKTA